MDQGWAALIGVVIGAVVGFGGTGLTLFFQERRASSQDRRLQAEKLGRVLGMVRMVAVELHSTHVKVKTTPLPEPGKSMERPPTVAWDRYGPDICAELPLSVLDPVLIAYAQIEINTGRGQQYPRLTSEKLGAHSQTAEGMDAITENRAAAQQQRDALLSNLLKGFDALQPYCADTKSLAPILPRE